MPACVPGVVTVTDRWYDPVVAVADREFRAVVRTRLLLVLVAGYAVVVWGVALAGSAGGGYLPLSLDLLVPMELLVPVLGFAFGYRAILGDRERGELAVVRTYPLDAAQFVAGVYLGRATALAAVVVVPLLAAGALVPLSRQRTISVLSAHATTDSPSLYLRFVVLMVLFALVVLAVALAVSAVARSVRQALGLAAAVGLATAVGIDATGVAGLAGGVLPESSVGVVLALSPNGAVRGLVFATVVDPVTTGGVSAGLPPLLSLSGLAVWAVGSAALATRAVDRP